jgi:divalent metal cation (Fe/Co/Zn/Cd) transporter
VHVQPLLNVAAGPGEARRETLRRRVRLIVAATIGYNVVEAVVALGAGHLASSTALVAFGLDSVVEVLSAAAVAWQFAASDHERRERTALRLIAISFFGLAAFVGVDAITSLLTRQAAEHSPAGIALAAVSLVVMPFLSWAERRTGRELGSASAVADSAQTLLCTYLSAVLLVGLVLNSTLGWYWADPVAGLVIAAVAVNEGRNAWKGDACCAPSAPSAPSGGSGPAACEAGCCDEPDSQAQESTD